MAAWRPWQRRARPTDRSRLIISAWDVLFAVIVVSWIFGWTGGKALVESSYEDAKVKSKALKAKRKRHKSEPDT